MLTNWIFGVSAFVITKTNMEGSYVLALSLKGFSFPNPINRTEYSRQLSTKTLKSTVIF